MLNSHAGTGFRSAGHSWGPEGHVHPATATFLLGTGTRMPSPKARGSRGRFAVTGSIRIAIAAVAILLAFGSIESLEAQSFQDGFEGSLSFWSLTGPGTATLNGGFAHSGNQALKLTASSSFPWAATARHDFGSDRSGTVAVWVQGQQLCCGSGAGLQIFNSAGDHWALIQQSGNINCNTCFVTRASAGVGESDHAFNAAASTWHKFEIEVGASGATFSFDGAAISTYASVTMFRFVELTVWGGPGGTAYFDDFSSTLNPACQVTGPCITNPTDGAHPTSAFVALSGVGTAGSSINILRDAAIVNTAVVDGDGAWEKVVYIGPGPHTMRVEYTGDPGSLSGAITVNSVGAFPAPFVPISTFEKLKTADVILTLSLTSIQISLYGPTYSHSAIYLGGNTDGTPLIAEAVPPGEAGSFGQVRTVSLENSTVYTDGRRVDVYRRADLSAVERTAIVAWAAGKAALGLQYWNIYTDLTGEFLPAAGWWNFTAHQPKSVARFNGALGVINSEKFRTDKFICSTLVWRSYYEGTNHRVDLSLPNNIVVSPTSILGNWVTDPAFIDQLRPYFVFPDTIALSGKVALVP